ncbi:MAG: lipopolysaccharide kinase InaA family protein [Bdellovibrionales bacterium]|nr:lipopolysaccharide kinase InaA family protein [Bdellovibrionales bacterium]
MTNEKGIVVGQLLEVVNGTNLEKLVGQNRISREQLRAVKAQLIQQVEILFRHGVRHGDLVAANVLVELGKDSVSANLIDFQKRILRAPERSLDYELQAIERMFLKLENEL